jgi:hypothetical protein
VTETDLYVVENRRMTERSKDMVAGLLLTAALLSVLLVGWLVLRLNVQL